ncbi:RNA polymerase II transcription elongation factor-domain-containing protein [Mycena amicta]|nr:RNA polymerase II transcription elongation factor-domain-containing protein [Mycena amicta]
MDSSDWVPTGTHNVVIGPSLNKALKARKGLPAPPPKRAGPPERDFYSFRYNFKPPSVDTSKPGTIELVRSKEKDSTAVSVEHPSSQPGETHTYNGTETTAKEFDCVLIFDEQTGDYKLEKLEAYLVLTYAGRRLTQALPAATTSTPAQPDPELDAEGEVDDDLPQYHDLRQEEEEEAEEGELPVKQTKPFAPKPRPEAAPPKPLAKPPPQRKTTKKAPPPLPPLPADIDGDAYEEDLEFGKPTVKRPRKTPPPAAPAPADLSLPSSSSAWTAPPPAKSQPPMSDSEDGDSEWEPVPTGPVVATTVADPNAPIEVDIDMNDFEAELEAELFDAGDDGSDGEQEDFLASAMPNTSDPPPPTKGAPLSMSQYSSQLGGGAGGYSDDEYSSSEDSDDD